MKSAFYILLFLLSLVSCSENGTSAKKEPIVQQPASSLSNSSNNSGGSNYHSNPNYKYEYRKGYKNNYEYNYDVNGSDQDGNGVSGNIDVSGKYGTGTIEDENGNEKSIDVEWVDYGVMEGTDEDGNSYELEVD